MCQIQLNHFKDKHVCTCLGRPLLTKPTRNLHMVCPFQQAQPILMLGSGNNVPISNRAMNRRPIDTHWK